VAPSLIRRLAWPLAAAAALLFVVGLALTGQRPDAGLTPFKAAGLMTAFAPEEAREIEVATSGMVWRFRRGETWHVVEAPRPVPSDVAQRIDVALRLLRNAGPLRVLTADEVSKVPASEYAFGPESLRVEVRSASGATFRIQFGGANPLGAARYTRVEGVEGLPMLPIHAAEAWEQVIGELQK
jgi:hypothetical protein